MCPVTVTPAFGDYQKNKMKLTDYLPNVIDLNQFEPVSPISALLALPPPQPAGSQCAGRSCREPAGLPEMAPDSKEVHNAKETQV